MSGIRNYPLQYNNLIGIKYSVADKSVENDGASRDGEQGDTEAQKATSHTTQTSGGYRAVAPDVKSSHDQAERR